MKPSTELQDMAYASWQEAPIWVVTYIRPEDRPFDKVPPTPEEEDASRRLVEAIEDFRKLGTRVRVV